jgi:hypothetical protein
MWIPRRRLGDSRLFARCRISHSCHALQYPYRHVYLLLSNAHSLSFLLSRRNLSQFPLLLFPHFMHSFLSLFFCHHSSSFSHSSTNSPRHSPFHSLASRAHFLSLHPRRSLSLSHTHTSLSFPGHLTSVNIVRGGIAVLAEASKGKQGAFDLQV